MSPACGTCSRVSFLTVSTEVRIRAPTLRRERPVTRHRSTASSAATGSSTRWPSPAFALAMRRSCSITDRDRRGAALQRRSRYPELREHTSASARPTAGFGGRRRRSPCSASRSASSRPPSRRKPAQAQVCRRFGPRTCLEPLARTADRLPSPRRPRGQPEPLHLREAPGRPRPRRRRLPAPRRMLASAG